MPAGLVVDGRGVVDEVAAPAVELDQRDLLGAGRRGHHRDERQTEHAGEVGLAHRRRPARGLDDGAALGNLPRAQAVQEQRAGQPVLEAAGRVRRLVLEIEVDAPLRRQRVDQQVRVGAAPGIGLDGGDRPVHPGPGGEVRAVDVAGGGHARMITHRRSRYDDGQTHPRVIAAAWVAAQKRSEMASCALSACGHISQAPSTAGPPAVGTPAGTVKVGVAVGVVMRRPD